MMRRTRLHGFSLIEMIVAITVLGILSASAAIFLRGPIASYFDTERRTGLADTGALAMAKLRQDITNAVPNGVRTTIDAGGRTYIELLPMRVSAAGVPSQGRYRIDGPGNVLNFGVPDTGFDVLGPAVEVQTGDWIVVNNHLATASVWTGTSRATYTGPSSVAAATLSMVAHTFAADAPDHRFQIATNPVTYVCDPGARTLSRIAGYGAPAATQPTAFGAGTQNDLLARDIRFCRAAVFPGNLRRAQVVAFEIGFERSGDRLNLAHTVRVGALP